MRWATQTRWDECQATGDCELCRPENVLLEGSRAYVRYDNNSLSRGHVLVVPRRHVASYFDMTVEEKAEIQSLLDRAQTKIVADHSPDGYNIGVNIGRAAGQNRMHVHVHLTFAIRAAAYDAFFQRSDPGTRLRSTVT